MSQHCHGDPKCEAPQFCECLPEGVVAGASATTKKAEFTVIWCGMTVAHCRTPKQALAKARKMNKKNEGQDKYVAVRVTTTTKTEVLKTENEE